MKPEWRKDPNARDIQPLQLPQFEVAGMQRDHIAYAKALQWLTRRALAWGLIIVTVPLAFFLFNSIERYRGTFGQFQQVETTPTRQNIDMRLISFERKEEIEGFLFTTKAPADHFFYVVKVRVTNRSSEKFSLTPFAFAIESGGGERFNVDSRTRTLSNDLGSSSLSKDETVEGRLLFSVPRSRVPRTLILRSMNGQVARVRTP
jgi:hypothetical protein